MSQTGHPDSSKLFNKLFKKSSFLCVFFAISEQVRKLFHTCEHVENGLIWGAGNALICIHFLKQRTRAFTKLPAERGDGLIWGAGNALTFFHQYVFFHDATKMWKKNSSENMITNRGIFARKANPF